MRERRGELEAAGARAIAVGFSPPDALAALAKYLEWPWPFLSDPDREVYRRLGAPRAGLRDVYTAGTLRRYGSALLHGRRIRRPVEDTRQLGADAIVREGRAVWLHLPRSPDDRPGMPELLRALAG